MTSLFEPLSLGALEMPNRVVMAPMTRCRTDQPGNIPNAMMADYYAQRASAGLIVTEATQISPQGQGYSFTPGIHTPAQIAGWQGITAAVHTKGGRIINQLWHVGRMSLPMFQNGGLPVAPSALAPEAAVWVVDPVTGQGGMQACPVPRALDLPEIAGIVQDYATAARNARKAGFDGAEIHGGNGYLVDEFLRASSNQRGDAYGGSPQNRLRFALEVAEAVAGEMGADRSGIRFSPFITQRGMNDPTTPETVLQLARELDRIGLAYIHLAEADWDDAPETPLDFRKALRAAFGGKIIAAGGFTAERAEALLKAGLVDAVAFGRSFIANPDLPRRLKEHLPLAGFDGAALFGGKAEGYSSYPAWGA